MEKVKEWERDLIKAKFINLAQPGQDIFIGVNTRKYQIPDNSEAVVPRAVLEVIKHTEHKAWKFDKKTQTNKMYLKQRMLAIVIKDPYVKKEEPIEEILNDGAPIEIPEIKKTIKMKVNKKAEAKKIADLVEGE